MSYELQVNAGVTGQDQLSALTAATEKQEDRTKRIAQAIQDYISKNEKLTETQAKLALDETKLEQLREKHRMTLEKMAAAAQKSAETQEQANARIGASVKNFITDPLGAAGTAAEKFIVTFGTAGIAAGGFALGIGVIGGALLKNASDTAKYAQEISNLASRTGLTTSETQLFSRASEVAGINAGTLTTAMRTLSRGMSENSDEGKKQKKVLEELGMGADAAFKPMGVLLPEIFQKLSEVGNVMERDRMTITLFGRSGLEMEPLFARFKELEARVSASGVVMDRDGIEKAKQYQEQLVLLGFKWDALKQKLGEGAIGVITLALLMNGMSLEGSNVPTHATGQEVLDQNREKARIALHAQFAQGNQAALDTYDRTHRDPKAEATEQLKTLGEDRTAAENKVRGAVDEPGRAAAIAGLAKIDGQIAAIKAQTKAAEDLKAALERETELRKRSQELYDNSFNSGENSPQKKYDDSKTRIAAERQDAIRKPGSDMSAIYADTDLQERAAFVTFIAESAKKNAIDVARLEQEGFREALKAGELADKQWEEVYKTADKTAERMEKSAVKSLNDNRESQLKIDEDDLKNLRNMGGRALGQVGIRGQLSGASAQQTADETYSLRISQAQEEYQLKLKIADLGKTQAEQDAARIVALDDKNREIFDAQMSRENALLEVALKQKEAAAQMAGGLFDALRSHSTGLWFKDFAVGQGKQLFTNAAGPILATATHALGSVIPASAQTGVLGGLLHDTVFDSKNAPVDTAKNTLETVKQVIGLRSDLKGIFTGNPDPNTPVTPGGGGGSSVYNLPGTNAFNPFMGPGGGLMGTGIGSGTSSVAALFGLGATGVGTGIAADLSQFTKGIAAGPSMALARILGTQPPAGTVGYGSDGTPHDQYGNPIVTSTATQIGQGVGIAAGAAAGTMAAVKSFSQGGASGALGGSADILGMAAMIPGPQQPFIAAAAAITGLVGSMLSTGPQQRMQQITDDINKNQYLAPTALNVTQGMNGTYEDFDARGNLRTSNLSAVPTVAEPYITKRTINGQQGWYDAPGVVTAPYSGGATGTGQTPVAAGPVAPAGGTTIIVNGGIQAMDASTFHEYLQKPSSSMAVGDSLATHLQSHEGRASNAIRYVAGS